MSNPYKPSYGGIAFAATLAGLVIAATATWVVARHEPVMAELRLAADREQVTTTVALPDRTEPEPVSRAAGEPAAGDATPATDAPAPETAVAETQDAEPDGGDVLSATLPSTLAADSTDQASGPAAAATGDTDTPATPVPSIPRFLNAEPFVGPTDLPRIVLIINELGRLDIETEAAIAAPAAVTLAFSPYGRDLETWIGRARQSGHETLTMLPMEPLDYPRDDPGPLALLTNLGVADNAERLTRILDDADQSVGIIGQAGSQFLTEQQALEPVLATLAEAGFLFVDTNVTADAVAEIAAQLDLPVVEIDVMVTETALRGAIDRRLQELETIARDRGYAVGLADAYPVFLEQLSVWSERLEIRGFTLAPVTAVIDSSVGSVDQ